MPFHDSGSYNYSLETPVACKEKFGRVRQNESASRVGCKLVATPLKEDQSLNAGAS